MFAGPTAAEWATINETRGDLPRPKTGQACECGCGRCNGARVPARSLQPIYGVGCKVVEWQALCETCRDYHGSEETFWCQHCDHEHQTNTSWELHYAEFEGEQVCLACYAQLATGQHGFWVSEPSDVTDEWVRSRPHFPLELAPSLSETGLGLTLDSMSGGELYDETAGAGHRGTLAIRAEVEKALREHDRVAVVITRAHQFAVYLEVVSG